jgi:hypothetical protein
LPENKVRYADLFTPDGRIMTRMSPQRAEIIKKLRANPTLNDAAMPYWTKRRHGRDVTATLPTGFGCADWEEQRLIKYGIALRGKVEMLPGGGHVIYKGENVTATRFTGEPVYSNLDVTKADSPSVWAFQTLLPPTMFALPTIEQVPVAASFDPRRTAVLNTVVVFGPRTELAGVPFDVIFLSNIYDYWYILAGRRSFQNKIRSHIYPTSVAELPWNDLIACRQPELEVIHNDLMDACQNRYETVGQLKAEAARLGLRPLREVVRGVNDARIAPTEAFKLEPKFPLLVGGVVEEDGFWLLPLDELGEHPIIFDAPVLAALARAGLPLADGEEVSWTSLINAPIPTGPEMAEQLETLRARFEPAALDAKIEEEIAKLDAIIGEALGLDRADIDAIRHEMAEDPFLSRVRPRYPYFRPRQHGRRLKLERKDRYSPVV